MAQSMEDRVEVVEVTVKYNFRGKLYQLTFAPPGPPPCSLFFDRDEFRLALHSIPMNEQVELHAAGPWEMPGVMLREIGEAVPVTQPLGRDICWHDCMTCNWYCCNA